MRQLQSYRVFPKIPEPLSFLEKLARNLWWCWEPHAKELFRRINPKLWETCGRNPITFSSALPPDRLEELAVDDSFLAHQARVSELFSHRVAQPVDRPDSPYGKNEVIAYFSMEYGLHESIPFFAGGLGVLAGDHLKASSSMGLPIVGIGLLYRQGYFFQFLDQEGNQREKYPTIDLYHLPLTWARDLSGNKLVITVPGPEGEFKAAVWKMQVGRIPLYLLDTNLQENQQEIRNITARLYAGDSKTRLSQELLLGIGGVRVLTALGLSPKVSHMNEGHSAFSSLERLAWFMSTHHVDLETALEIVPRSTIFTTHTPVAAGHDEFPPDLVSPILKTFQDLLGTSGKEILSWGQLAGQGSSEPFSMFVLGLRMSEHYNGVSRLHGHVARKMWSRVWPNQPVDEVPISHITNGIHLSTWTSRENAHLFQQYLGPEWYLGSRKPDNVEWVDDITDVELWHSHEMSRARLIATCRKQMVEQYGRRNAPSALMEAAARVLDKDTLTIGFARRFATYKRATLLLHDMDRLKAMFTSKDRPIQIIFAGKAHPKDNEGKALIKRIVEFAGQSEIRQKVVFLENYNMHLARRMIQGVDIWLNTPQRPFEACGTSGMKAAFNGGLNLSILDGWWAEGYTKETGWCIGNSEDANGDAAYQEAVDAQALYNVLENEVIPAFYHRKNGDMPIRWIKMMKAAMKLVMKDFCSFRMVGQYENRYYMPAAKRVDELLLENGLEARNLAGQKKRLTSFWQKIKIMPPVQENTDILRVGDSFRVTVWVNLGEFKPDEVEVQLYYGKLKSIDAVISSHCLPMTIETQRENGDYLYVCTLTCDISGRSGYTARVIPKGDAYVKNTPGFVTWA